MIIDTFLARMGLPRGAIGLALRHGDTPHLAATPAVLDAMRELTPDFVCVHSGPDKLTGIDTSSGRRVSPGVAGVVAALRAASPSTKIHLDYGLDYWTEQYALGRKAHAIRACLAVHELGLSLGIKGFGPNLEKGKSRGTADNELAAEVIKGARALDPDAVLIFSSYGDPGDSEHRLAYEAWKGADLFADQSYLFGPGDGGIRGTSARLTARVERSGRSGDAAARDGCLPPDWRERRVPYVQSYRTDSPAYVAALRGAALVKFWTMGPGGIVERVSAGEGFDLDAAEGYRRLRALRGCA